MGWTDGERTWVQKFYFQHWDWFSMDDGREMIRAWIDMVTSLRRNQDKIMAEQREPGCPMLEEWSSIYIKSGLSSPARVFHQRAKLNQLTLEFVSLSSKFGNKFSNVSHSVCPMTILKAAIYKMTTISPPSGNTHKICNNTVTGLQHL